MTTQDIAASIERARTVLVRRPDMGLHDEVAAAEGITLDSLEVRTDSRSDARGLLRLPGDDGGHCHPGPQDVRLVVRIAAAGVPPERLRALVDTAQRCSPMGSAIEQAVPVALQVEVLNA